MIIAYGWKSSGMNLPYILFLKTDPNFLAGFNRAVRRLPMRLPSKNFIWDDSIPGQIELVAVRYVPIISVAEAIADEFTKADLFDVTAAPVSP